MKDVPGVKDSMLRIEVSMGFRRGLAEVFLLPVMSKEQPAMLAATAAVMMMMMMMIMMMMMMMQGFPPVRAVTLRLCQPLRPDRLHRRPEESTGGVAYSRQRSSISGSSALRVPLGRCGTTRF
jgi:hypothetical protein